MTNRSGCYAVAVIIVSAILFPADAESQTLARSFQELQGIARQGDSILVTDGAGHRVRAKIEELSPSTLTVLDENGLRRTLPEDDVRVIERARSLRKPVLIGLGLGAALGFGTAVSRMDVRMSAASFRSGWEDSPRWVLELVRGRVSASAWRAGQQPSIGKRPNHA